MGHTLFPPVEGPIERSCCFELRRQNGRRHWYIAKKVRELYRRVHKVLELIGTTTVADSFQCSRPGGIVCMTGMAGNKRSFDDFSP